MTPLNVPDLRRRADSATVADNGVLACELSEGVLALLDLAARLKAALEERNAIPFHSAVCDSHYSTERECQCGLTVASSKARAALAAAREAGL